MKKAILLSLPITVAAITISLLFRIYIAHTVDAKSQTYFYTTLDLASIMAVLFIGFRSSMTVAYAKSKDGASVTNLFRLILIIATLLAALLFSYPIHLFVDSEVPSAVIAAMFVSFGLYIYFTNRLAMFRLYKSINAVTFLEPLFLALFFFLFFWLTTDALSALLLAAIFENICLSVILKLTNKQTLEEPKFFRPKLEVAELTFLKNSALSSIEFAFGILFIYMAIIFSKLFFGLTELALYQVVIKPVFMYGITLLVFPIVKFAFPHISGYAATGKIDKIIETREWINRYALVTSGLFIIALLVIGEDGIGFVFGDAYKKGFTGLAILSFALYFAIMNAFYISTLKAFERFKLSMLLRLSSVLFFIIIFFTLQLFYKSFNNITIALALSYLFVNFFARWEIAKLTRQAL
jgi:O-antigen/teichoic acid export membrane protein